MHVYTIDTYIKRRKTKTDRDKMNESLESNFLLAAVGKSFQPTGQPGPEDPVIKTLANMSVAYDLAQIDDLTTAAELTQILEFAEYLGLVPSAAGAAGQFSLEFPNGFGAVSAKYIVRYDDRAVRNAFTLSGDDLERYAQVTARHLVAAKFTALPITDVKSWIGFAYLEPEFIKIAYGLGTNALKTTKKLFFLPPWFTKGPAKKVSLDEPQRIVLATLFNVEKSYAKRLRELDELVDAATTTGTPVKLDDLVDAARRFVKMADSLDTFGRVNTFFAIFDKLAREGSSSKGRRRAALILEITPPGREKVTKFLMA
jgi:hypothetical protein